MGFGSLATPSAASQLMLDKDKLEQHLQSVQAHLEGIIQNGLHHMRKDELWKRMLYGSGSTGMETKDSRPAVSNIHILLRCSIYVHVGGQRPAKRHILRCS